MNWTEDQIESFFESENQFATLTLHIDKNGILSLIKVKMEFHEYITEIEPSDIFKKSPQVDAVSVSASFFSNFVLMINVQFNRVINK